MQLAVEKRKAPTEIYIFLCVFIAFVVMLLLGSCSENERQGRAATPRYPRKVIETIQLDPTKANLRKFTEFQVDSMPETRITCRRS